MACVRRWQQSLRQGYLSQYERHRRMTAEMIVTNAKVLTMDAAHPRAEAVALAGGKIVAVGSAAVVGALAGPETLVLDCLLYTSRCV